MIYFKKGVYYVYTPDIEIYQSFSDNRLYKIQGTELIVVKVDEQKTAAGKKKVSFELQAGQGRTICLAGSFNDWEPDNSRMNYNSVKKCYQSTLELAPGYYEYKFVINGEWVLDEANPNFAANDFGTLNSVVIISEN